MSRTCRRSERAAVEDPAGWRPISGRRYGVKASAAAVNCPACAAGPQGGLLYAGSAGDARYAFDPHKGNFQPRAGVAWRIASKLVFRGGYGLSYLGQNSNGQAVGFSRQTPLVPSLDTG